MALAYDYDTLTITVPQADLTLVSGTLFTLDTEAFRLLLAAEQASERGIVFITAYTHNTEVTIVGTTYARLIEIFNGWNIEFEDGQYSVQLEGSNNNYWDIAGLILVQNQVQVIPTNSAGLIVGVGGSSLTAQQTRDAMELETTGGQASVDTKLNNNFAIGAAAL